MALTPILSATPPSAARDTFESRLGARWAVWVGGIALAFGGIFLIRYSIESGLLGPAARLTLAVVFGLLLVAAGELIRRKALPQVSDRYGNAMIPGALTAAGAVTLLAATYAAHGYYGFIGPTLAFVLLGLISFATLALGGGPAGCGTGETVSRAAASPASGAIWRSSASTTFAGTAGATVGWASTGAGMEVAPSCALSADISSSRWASLWDVFRCQTMPTTIRISSNSSMQSALDDCPAYTCRVRSSERARTN